MKQGVRTVTQSNSTSELDRSDPNLLRWVSAATTLLALAATYALAVMGYPEAAVATVAIGTVSGISVTVNVMRH